MWRHDELTPEIRDKKLFTSLRLAKVPQSDPALHFKPMHRLSMRELISQRFVRLDLRLQCRGTGGLKVV